MDSRLIGKVSEADGRSADAAYRRLSDSLMRRVGKGVEWSRELQSFSGAMLLGRRDGIPYGRLAVFAAAGTIHVFAISGLHVMLIAGLLNGFLKAFGLSRRMCAACAIPMLAGYVMLIGYPPSAVRAGLMVSLYLGAYLFGRRNSCGGCIIVAYFCAIRSIGIGFLDFGNAVCYDEKTKKMNWGNSVI